jgi:NADH-quinone oxidoreductase subunit F
MGTRSDIALIGDVAKNMLGRTFCPLGDAAAMPTISFVEKFYPEFEAHLEGRPCPYEGNRGEQGTGDREELVLA